MPRRSVSAIQERIVGRGTTPRVVRPPREGIFSALIKRLPGFRRRREKGALTLIPAGPVEPPAIARPVGLSPARPTRADPSAMAEPSMWWITPVLVTVYILLMAAAGFTATNVFDPRAALQAMMRRDQSQDVRRVSADLVRFREAIASIPASGANLDKVGMRQRLNALTEHAALLRTGETGDLVHADPSSMEVVANLDQAVASAAPLMDKLNQAAVRVRLMKTLDPLESELARLTAGVSRRAEAQAAAEAASAKQEAAGPNWVLSAVLLTIVGCLAFMAAVTDRMRKHVLRQARIAKETADAAIKAANAASLAKSRFLANMSHELRTPMNGVLGMVELIKEGELSEKQRRFADIAHQSGKMMVELIGSILDHSRIEAGQLQLVEAPVDIRDLVRRVTETVSAEAGKKGLTLTATVAANVPAALLGDVVRLRQVLINLLANAIRFTDEGDIAITVTVTKRDPAFCTLRFAIVDTGIGIERNELPKVFDAFRQADDSSTRREGGTGLGLTIVRQLTEMMGGEINVTSQPGMGSTFSFTARLRHQRPGEFEKHLDPSLIAELSVLLVAADDQERTSIKDYLSSWGVRTVSTNSGERALTLASRARATGRGFDQVLVSVELADNADGEFITATRRDPLFQRMAITVIGGDPDNGSSLERPVQRTTLFEVLSETAQRRAVASTAPAPVAAVNSTAPNAPAAPDAAPETKPKIKALLVEDNPINRMVASEYLKRAGCDVDQAVHGGEAVERCRHAQYDIIFMDCQMPEVDGFEATRIIREEHAGPERRIPIVALTANAMDGDKAQCAAAGMDDYLVKPTTQNIIAEALRRWVPQPGRTLVDAK